MSTTKKTTNASGAPLAPRFVSVGGLTAVDRFLDDIRFPFLPTLPAVACVRDALQKAIAERKGVVVIGPKGTGRTMARQRVLTDFREGEADRAAADAATPVRVVVEIECPRTHDQVEVLGLIWRAVTGSELPRRGRHRNRPYEDLRDELLALIEGMHIVALVVDEAEYLTRRAFAVLRDLVSLAETRTARRVVEGEYRAGGLGVVLLATPTLTPILAANEELAQRWTAVINVPLVANADLPALYAALLPCCAAVAEGPSASAFRQLVQVKLWGEEEVAVRRVENHLREYVRCVFNHLSAQGEAEGLTVATIPFDPQLFGLAHDRCARPDHFAAA